MFKRYYSFFHNYLLSYRYAELGTRNLKSTAAAAYRYLNKKVAPLPLLAYKIATTAATLEQY